MPAYVVTCSSCGTANRVPAEKEGKSGRCGNCRTELPLMYYRPQQLTDRSYDTFISRYSGPVLAELWAPWCPHCKSFEPAVRKVAELLAGTAAVVQINTQENPGLAGRFGVRGIPALLLIRNGNVIDQLSGAQSSEAVIAWFRRH
ncbi:MAG: thioredoxin fold domain-containing protein [Proteobacteria bacterium]|nr:thioredoxin fold domain-containing protein [Pseudomonadota bacterium]